MNYEDFIRQPEEEVTANAEAAVEETAVEGMEEPIEPSIDLDVQKAVVESLAADKAALDVELDNLRRENNSLKSKITDLNVTIANLKDQLSNVGDIISRNMERPVSTQISLLDRNIELDDRFEGETRDHVLEVLKEARDACEKDGRNRRAQILESVLVANESRGLLAEKRAKLEKLFSDNQNIINGQVINELDKVGIAYKVGENYLLPKEILKRVY